MWGEMRGRGCVVSGRVRDSIFALVFNMEGGGKINFFGSDLPLLVALDTLGRVVGEEGKGCGGRGGLWGKGRVVGEKGKEHCIDTTLPYTDTCIYYSNLLWFRATSS